MTTSASRNNPKDWADVEGTRTRSELGRIRRFLIGVTSRTLWQLIGHKMLDGTTETRQAEAFGGAGIAARPGGRNAECIVVFLGKGASAPMIVAIRDQQMHAALVAALTGGELKLGETALYSGVQGEVQALVHVKMDGTIEARTPGGDAVSLAKQSSVEDLRTKYNSHTHLYSPGPGAAAPTAVPVPLKDEPIDGTDVLKGE